jgi:hypothetical protein
MSHDARVGPAGSACASTSGGLTPEEGIATFVAGADGVDIAEGNDVAVIVGIDADA